MKAMKITIAAIATLISIMVFGSIVMAAVTVGVALPAVIMVGVICSVAVVVIAFASFVEAIED